MRRYFIKIKFRGTAYHGWQIQENAPSVQEVIQEKLRIYFQKKIEIVGAGRTDQGVHALKMVAHFDVNQMVDSADFIHRLNSLLPEDISINDIFEVPEELHARFSALSRTYHYQLCFQKDPFIEDYCLRLNNKPNIELMNQAAELLLGKMDFSCFSKSHTQTHTNDCEIFHAKWQDTGDVWAFEIRANRFLRNMVRAIVGTLIEIGEGKREVSDIPKLIASKDRSSAGNSVPAKGLFLSEIEYPDGEII